MNELRILIINEEITICNACFMVFGESKYLVEMNFWEQLITDQLVIISLGGKNGKKE